MCMKISPRRGIGAEDVVLEQVLVVVPVVPQLAYECKLTMSIILTVAGFGGAAHSHSCNPVAVVCVVCALDTLLG